MTARDIALAYSGPLRRALKSTVGARFKRVLRSVGKVARPSTSAGSINVWDLSRALMAELEARRVSHTAHAYSDFRDGEASLYAASAAANIVAQLGVPLGDWQNRKTWADHIATMQRARGDLGTESGAHATCMAIQALNILGASVDASFGTFAPRDRNGLDAFVAEQDWRSTHKQLWGTTAPLIAGHLVDAEWVRACLSLIERRVSSAPGREFWHPASASPHTKISCTFHILQIYDAASAPYPFSDRLMHMLLSLDWPDVRHLAQKTYCTDADWAWMLSGLAQLRPEYYRRVRRVIREVSHQRVGEWNGGFVKLREMSTHHIHCFLWSTALFQNLDRESFTGPRLLDTMNEPSLFRIQEAA